MKYYLGNSGWDLPNSVLECFDMLSKSAVKPVFQCTLLLLLLLLSYKALLTTNKMCTEEISWKKCSRKIHENDIYLMSYISDR